MSNKLVELIESHILRNGSRGKAELAMAAGRSEQMIDRYRKRICSPSQSIAYNIALACGCKPKEATQIATETSEAKETA